jgi:hypothetical protein
MSGNELNVSVKALEWKEIDLRVGRPPMVVWEAKTPFTNYELESVMERPWFCSFICAHFSDLDAAKAACQADYERRVLSALSPQPVTKPAPVQHVLGWIYEDELPKDYPYDSMFPFSKVDGVRLFPVFAPVQHEERDDPDVTKPAMGGGDEGAIEAAVNACPMNYFQRVTVDDLNSQMNRCGVNSDDFRVMLSVYLERSSLKEIREENDRLRKHMRYTVPMHADGNYVFIDGPGDVELDHGGEMRARIEQLEKENDRLKGERDEAQSDHLKALADLAEAKGESSLFSADAKTAWAECVELREENKSLSELLTAAVDDYNNALASCEAMAKALEQSREAHMLLIDPKHIIGSSVLDALAKVTAAEVTARAALDAYRKEKGE